MALSIVVNGQWQTLAAQPGDVEMSTCWPGGSDTLAWTPGTATAGRFQGGETVAAYMGPACVWAGSLQEPDPSQDKTSALGAWREAENFAALDGSLNASKVCDTAIDTAIGAGLRWTRPTSIRSGGVGNNLDITQGPVTLANLLDILQDLDGVRWGVNTNRQVFTKADDTTPTYQTLPLDNGLGFALDNYASTLIGRYLDSTTSTYKTVTATDGTASHGVKQQIVDLVTGRGALSSTAATNVLTNLFALSKATPQWTVPIELNYGELLSMGGVPVALETVTAGTLLRVHGGFELPQRLNGQMYLDILIGRTELSEGTLTITPLQLAARSLADVLTAALTK